MGNHDVGRGMTAAARAFWAGNGDAAVSPEKALAVLDAAAEDYIGADAEFDDAMTTDGPLTRLVVIAFEATPEQVAGLKDGFDDDAEWDSWYEGPYAKFSARYKFC